MMTVEKSGGQQYGLALSAALQAKINDPSSGNRNYYDKNLFSFNQTINQLQKMNTSLN